MSNRDGLMRSARVVVRLAFLANRLFLVAVSVGLVLSLVFAGQFAALVGRSIPAVGVASALVGMRWLMLLGMVMAVATDRLMIALTGIIAAASAGDPFIAGNARQLQRIGWCLLVLQLCEVPGAMIAQNFPAMGSAAPSGDVSIAGWISVLMVFVLARVFAVGAAMRDDLAGTI